jgi:transcription elongation factor GreA
MDQKFKLTKEGLAEHEAELKELIGSRPEIAEKIKVAREQGDLKENAEYQAARDEQSHIEDRITELEHILKNVEIIKSGKKKDVVELGEEVTLSASGSDDRVFTIVGSLEANPSEGKVSNESPMGEAILGKKVGDTIEVNGKKYKIKRVQ